MAEFARGALPAAEAREVESHAVGCGLCAHWISELALEESAVASRPAASWKSRIALPAAAAACLFAGTGWFLFSSLSGSSKPGDPAPEGRLLAWEERTLRTRDGQEEIRILPDGSRVRLHGGTQVEFNPPARGERALLDLRAGSLEVETAPGAGRFRVRGSGGEVEALGTRFIVRSLGLDGSGFLDGFPSGAVLCVEVHEGKVSLANDQGRVVLTAPMRGIAFADAVPIAQERAGTPQETQRRFLETVEQTRDGWRVRPGQEALCRFLAAAFWGSGAEAAVQASPISPVLWQLLTAPERKEGR